MYVIIVTPNINWIRLSVQPQYTEDKVG